MPFMIYSRYPRLFEHPVYATNKVLSIVFVKELQSYPYITKSNQEFENTEFFTPGLFYVDFKFVILKLIPNFRKFIPPTFYSYILFELLYLQNFFCMEYVNLNLCTT